MESTFDIEQAIREYLPNIVHMSLATCDGSKPWVCEVHFAYDDELNIYFRSLPSRRHSQEIAKNPNVAGNIVTQHELGVAPRGVYFEGTAEQLQDVDESHPAYTAIANRLGVGSEILEDARKPQGHKFYKISVSDFYVFDARESKPSQKYHLVWPAHLR
ncbi:MAG TPA: pyridoxamine 5'-phosphate oxidase family protein [Patescibacteria group bacterium]|nr:pyridoxamine 5'-phosphate oxidase family protein [Patescibacteria group bacterium]